MNIRSTVLASLVLLFLGSSTAIAQSAPEGKATILKAADIKPTLFPERVFFRGKVAPTQMRNSGGVHFADGLYFLAGLVDNSGLSIGGQHITSIITADAVREMRLKVGETAAALIKSTEVMIVRP